MSEHTAHISWQDWEGNFSSGKFSRRHSWQFDGGLEVPASASPGVVPPPLSDPGAVDPEEAFVASVASCHMLTFLFIAYRKKFVVSSYEDDPVGSLSKNEQGIPWISHILLRPRILFSGDHQPAPEVLDEMHGAAHRHCFISNSVRTRVEVDRERG